jgi:hypothetical protein
MEQLSNKPTVLKLGYNLAGCEAAFARNLQRAIENQAQFTYLEIGVAEATTLLAVANLLKREDMEWKAIGLDILGGPFFNPNQFLIEGVRNGLRTKMVALPPNLIPDLDQFDVGVVLAENPRHIARFVREILDFVLIDGCHGAACVEADFLAIESKVYSGGIVAFHDACAEDQGQHFQQHCGEPINVRQALDLLVEVPDAVGSLILNCTRPGWTLLEEVHGDKTANPPGNGMIFFQKE